MLTVYTKIISKHKMKKRIRRIMDDEELGEETKLKIAMEKVCSIFGFDKPYLCLFEAIEVII